MMLTMWTLCHVLMCWLCIINAQFYIHYGEGLTEFPSSKIADSTTKIDVEYNNITAFEHNAFNNFSELVILYIGNKEGEWSKG